MAIYTMVFVLASSYQTEFLELFPRRLVSFLLFMSIFAFALTDISAMQIRCFKYAVVLVSLMSSTSSILIFALESLGGQLDYEAKDLVGSQRIGFVYLLALWIVYFLPRHLNASVWLRSAMLAIIVAGLFLTFSRSSVVSLGVVVALFTLTRTLNWFFVTRLGDLRKGIGVLCAIAAIIAGLYSLFPLTFEFYGDRLLDLFLSDKVSSHLVDPVTSEGRRIHILKTIFQYVMANPITGSGFLGIWILPEAGAGSSHNQYLDVMLRTGLPGLTIYLIMIVALLRTLKHDKGLTWGLVSMLVYGMFHETFKESQGTFILAFLIGMTVARERLRLRNRRSQSRPFPAPQASTS